MGASLHSVQDCDDFRVEGDKVPGLCAVVGASCDDLDRGGLSCDFLDRGFRW